MRPFARVFAIGLLCTALIGCLPDGDIGDKTEQGEQRRTAQAEGMARSLTVVGARAFNSFMTHPASPFEGATDVATIPTQRIDFEATFGLNLGPAGDMVNAGYCGDSGADARQSFIVWLNPTNSANRFAPTGLGDGATGDVMAQLSRMSDPSSIGTALNGEIEMQDGDDMSLGTCGALFNIPVGAPVLVYAGLELPDTMTEETMRTEMRTLACAAPKKGTITQTRLMRVVRGNNDTPVITGGADAQGWTTVSDLCSPDPNQSAIDITDGTANLLSDELANMVNGLPQSSDLALALGTLKVNDCKSGLITKIEVNPQTGEKEKVTYDTCTNERSTVDGIPALESELVSSEWDDIPLVRACSISTMTVADGAREVSNLPNIATALTGSLTSTPWQPSNGAKYKRKIHTYNVKQPNGSVNVVKLRDKYIGDTLNCRRTETIFFDVDAFAPEWVNLGVDRNDLSTVPDIGNRNGGDAEAIAAYNAFLEERFTSYTQSYQTELDKNQQQAGSANVSLLAYYAYLAGEVAKEQNNFDVATTWYNNAAAYPTTEYGERAIEARDNMDTSGGSGGSSGTTERTPGALYQREAVVDGWANAETLTPKTPGYTPWVLKSIGGRWEERVRQDFSCPDGAAGTKTSIRYHTLTDYKVVETSSWTESTNCKPCEDSGTCPEPCLEGEDVDIDECTVGQQGSITRRRTINVDNQCGVNSGWVITDTCTDRPDCDPPASGEWSVGSWGNCSQSCGGGTQTRDVTCEYTTCNGAQPATTQACNTQSCGNVCTNGPFVEGRTCNSPGGGGRWCETWTDTTDMGSYCLIDNYCQYWVRSNGNENCP